MEENLRSDPNTSSEAPKGLDRVGRALRVWLSKRRIGVVAELEPRVERMDAQGRRA